MIHVLKAGLWTSIQDRGRYGYRSIGVPLSGAMDLHSAHLANKLVGNPITAAILEFTAMGPELQFDKEAVIAITGATFGIFVNNEEQCINTIIHIKEGDCIKFTPPKKGWRGYLAIQGGLDSEVVLGSKSMYLGITEKIRIEKGAILNFSTISQLLKAKDKVLKPLGFDSEFIDVFKGPEYEILDDKTKENLINNNFKVHQNSNRMAIQIDGLGEVKFDDILTVPVQPGTVQITPSGKLLILMRDAQTTGGYPRVFQLTNDAVNKLAQKRPNDKIVFRITAI
ncbi:MAG: biotin-dependent carboxylase-like uncharacterized protein [Planctomycetota bacterium]|jgi:biotin-dependent carboxylase-like uncharacterized protein|uniref:5-oxoprolinase subunit C family protein n=1 Tax=Patiriisocius sp. Uisw_047 TaxID=3230969 RepID=UPI0039E9168A